MLNLLRVSSLLANRAETGRMLSKGEVTRSATYTAYRWHEGTALHGVCQDGTTITGGLYAYARNPGSKIVWFRGANGRCPIPISRRGRVFGLFPFCFCGLGHAFFKSQGLFFLGALTRCPPCTACFSGKSLFMSAISARSPVALVTWRAKESKLEMFWDANKTQLLSSGLAFHSGRQERHHSAPLCTRKTSPVAIQRQPAQPAKGRPAIKRPLELHAWLASLLLLANEKENREPKFRRPYNLHVRVLRTSDLASRDLCHKKASTAD